jgi:TRAP-type C4-dicarboxylate transport system permease small subunit
MGVTWAQRDRVHVRVSLLVEKFPLRMIAVVDTMVWVVAFVFVMILAVQSWHYATYAFSTKMFRWGNVQMPVWWVIALVPIGLWLFCGQLIIDIWTNIYRLTGRIPMEIGEIKTK